MANEPAAAVQPQPAAADPAAAAAAAAAAAEPKPAAAAVAEPAKPAAAAPAASKAPEKYALTVKAGDDVIAGVDTLKYIEEVARASDWSNDDAQAALDEHVQGVKAASARFLAATAADPDYGGTALAQSQQRMQKAIDVLRPVGHPRRDSFLRFIQGAGVTNHIEVLSLFADLGKLMSEDGGTGALGAAASAAGRDDVAKMYDKTPATP